MMVNDEELAGLIREVLERSSVALSPQDISRDLFKLDPDLVPRPIYNPNSIYAPSQRAYHTGAKCEGWFEVTAVFQGSFVARFDDGNEMTLKHGGTPQQMSFPVTEVAFLARKIHQLVARMPGLYRSADLWSVRPVTTTTAPDAGTHGDSRGQTRPTMQRKALAPAGTPRHVDSACQQHGIACFYHITHFDNLSGILAKGLLCHNRVEKHHDISDGDIQDRRHFKTLSQNRQITLHDCACLFVAPMPPMLSVRREIQEEIVYLHIDPHVLCLPGVEFTDGNAAASSTRFYRRPEDLDRLDWDVLRARYWSSDDPEQHVENKRLRAAEVLVPGIVPQTHITGITVMTGRARDRVAELLHEARRMMPVRVSPSMYYPQGSSEPRGAVCGDSVVPEPPPPWDDEVPY